MQLNRFQSNLYEIRYSHVGTIIVGLCQLKSLYQTCNTVLHPVYRLMI